MSGRIAGVSRISGGSSNVTAVRIPRYFRGKGPEEDEDSGSGSDVEQPTESAVTNEENEQDEGQLDNLFADSDEEDNAVVVRRAKREVETVVQERTTDGAAQESESSDDDEDAIARRRRLLKARLAESEEEEVLDRVEEAQESEGESDSSSEWETATDSDESESEEQPRILFKPTFVPKHARETIKQQEEQEQAEERKREEEAVKKEERKVDSKHLVKEKVETELERERLEEERARKSRLGMRGADLVDDRDDVGDADIEYDRWRLRELRRMKRDKLEREQENEVKTETEQRRTLSDRDIAAEKSSLDSQRSRGKTSMKYMQKYYHRGAFFMEQSKEGDFKEGIYNRDFTEATMDDEFDKSNLPKVMQVRNFGRAGQTKHRTMVEDDTSRQDKIYINARSTKHDLTGTDYLNKPTSRSRKDDRSRGK